jgi:hypothetical protein
VLFIGLATFVRSVAINWEDARWITGMNLLRRAYLEIVPELEPFFLIDLTPDTRPRVLGYGSAQRFANIASSLTTTSGVVAALNSVLAGSLASGLGAMFGGGLMLDVAVGGAVSLASAVLHVRYAARFRQTRASEEPVRFDEADHMNHRRTAPVWRGDSSFD